MSERNNQDKLKDVLGLPKSFLKNKERIDESNDLKLSEPISLLEKDDKYEDAELSLYTDLVELPSKGLFYSQDHPLYMKTHVEIKQVTGKEEKILTNKDYIKSGVALSFFVKNLIISDSLRKQENLNQMVDADRSAILTQARISAYGHEYQTQVMCPSCLKSDEYTFDLTSVKTTTGYFDFTDEEKENVKLTDDNLFEIKLPNSKLILTVCVSNFGLISKIDKLVAADKSIDFSTIFAEMVKFVNGKELTHEQKMTLHDSLRTTDLRYFRQIVKKLPPQFDIVKNWKCSHCEFEIEMDAPINSRFLYPDV